MSEAPAMTDLGAGDPWVLLHSFPVDRRMWAAQCAALAADGHRALALDLPGFGGAPRMANDPPSLDGYADAVLAALDALGLDRVTLVGLSLGGYVALRVAARAPGRLAGLVLADTRAAADGPEARAGRVLNLGLVRSRGPSALIEKMLPHLLGADAPEAVRAALRGWAGEQSAGGVSDALLAMRDRGDATPVLATIACPTLLLVGSQDTITPPAEHAAMAAAIAGSRVEVVEGAGHLSNLERPEAFNAALRRWSAGRA
ncbi:MAG: alpha/beta hydrolase fold protein [Myxococcaceae bacterium]|nr:alpha/beta hydrolase fold protein [Myxococcaceae bacterium]